MAPGADGGAARSADPRDAVRRVLADESLLRLVVQPLVDLGGATVAGWELLSRPDPALATDPRTLFDAAELCGLGADLHVLVVRLALALRAGAPSGTFLTLNLDPRSLVEPAVRRALDAAGDLRGVFVELTEKDWPDDEALVLTALAAVREQGAMVAMDDVGAGYSGLSQLLQVRPELVKLDRALVAGLGTDPAADAMLRAVGDLAARLDAWVLVEGVESQVQLAAAVRAGVPLAQGYLLGRPAAPWPDVELAPVRHLTRVLAVDDAVVSLLRAPEAFHVVRDDAGRPVRVASTLPDGTSWYHPAMTTSPATPVHEALDRALTRVQADRFSPVLVTSREGILLGGVMVEDLVAAVTRLDVAAAVPRQAAPVQEPPAVSASA